MEKKKITLITTAIVVLLIALFGTFLYFHEKKKAEYFYLFTGDINMIKWYYNRGEWYVVNNNEKLDDKFSVYSKGVYKGEYKLVFNDRWYYFDDYNKSAGFDNITFMVDTNYDFESFKFNYNYINDEVIANKVSTKVGLNINDYNYRLINVEINGLEDINNIYLIDFYKHENYDSKWPSYSVAFMYENGKIKIIKEVNSDYISQGYCSLKVNGVFTLDNSKPKLLLFCSNFDRLPNEYFLYEYSWDKFNLIMQSDGGKQS